MTTIAPADEGPPRADFSSDNAAGAPPEVVEALAAAAEGFARPYGDDPWTARVTRRLREIFERDRLAVLPVATGTAANALALAALTPPWGAVYCHREAHVHVDECGAPELASGGAKLIPLEGDGAKLTPATLEAAIRGAGDVHHPQPAAVTVSQATELGRVYAADELAALAAVARRHDLALHVDGARFANALVAGGATPAELTWKAGVDALSFGATKNGALAAEAILFFDPERAATLPFRRKRGGHLFSKMRFLSAQLEACLADDRWLAWAAHANRMAARLSRGLAGIGGIEVFEPTEANESFVRLPRPVIDGLRAAGFRFYDWGEPARREVRLVCSFATRAEEVDDFVAVAAELAAAT